MSKELYEVKVIVNTRVYAKDPMLVKFLENGIHLKGLIGDQLLMLDDKIKLFVKELGDLFK